MSRITLYEQADRVQPKDYAGLPVGKPSVPNINFGGLAGGETLEDFESIEVYLALPSTPDHAGLLRIIKVVDGYLTGDEDDDRDSDVVTILMSKESPCGDIRVQRETDSSLNLWTEQGQLSPYAVKRVVGVTLAGADSADVLNATTPDAAPTDEELGKVRNTGTGLIIARQRNQGGSITVDWVEYELLDDISTFWGESAGTYRWRGRQSRGSDVVLPLTGDVYMSPLGVFFANNPAGSNRGWLHLGTPNHFELAVNSQDEAEHNVDDDGEIFQWGQSLWVSDNYVEVALIRENYWDDVHHEGNPSAIWWGKNQTERKPSTYPNQDDGAAIRRVEFAQVIPNEKFNDIGDFLDDIFVDAADVSANIDGGLPALTDIMVFSLPVGRYNVYLDGGSSTGSDGSTMLGMVRIKENTDKTIKAIALAYNTSVLLTELMVAEVNIRKLIVTDPADQYYVAFGGLPNATNTRSSMEIEVDGA